MAKTYSEINERIRQGEVVVCTVEETIELVEQIGFDQAYDKVDIVTTATFGPMCSSGVFLNFGHSDPPIRMSETYINDVQGYAGIAAVDTYVGVTQESRHNHKYGGAHVIKDLIDGKTLLLEGKSKGSDCYPTKHIKREFTLNDLNEAYFFNPRNAYQNYSAAINTSSKDIFTYMGRLKANGANINYSTTGQNSPLLNDPSFKVIGIGTRIYFAGAQGYVSWYGTQFNSNRELNEDGIPKKPAGTIATIADLKSVKSEYIKPIYLKGYGISLSIGIAVPIPILDKDILKSVLLSDAHITTEIIDYSKNPKESIHEVTYQELSSGYVQIDGKKVKATNISNIKQADKLGKELKQEIKQGRFFLHEPIEKFTLGKAVKNMVAE
jgi:uncharacterized protein (DUF39 family)